MKLRDYLNEQTYEMNSAGGGKFKTNIPPEKRTYGNIPKYSNGKNKVKFQDWLMIKAEKTGVGKSEANGKWYGWSHRAIASFAPGDKVKGDNLGKKKETDPDFSIKDDKHAREVAMTFARNVA